MARENTDCVFLFSLTLYILLFKKVRDLDYSDVIVGKFLKILVGKT